MYMKGILIQKRRFRSKLEKKEVIGEYIDKNVLNIEKLIDQYYGYVYMIVKNAKSINISDEDVEEIISDTFFAIWKNSSYLNAETQIKPYLVGIVKNMLKKKYKSINIDDSILEYENKIIDYFNIDKITEEREQNKKIKVILSNLKPEEYKAFIMFYYEGKKIKDIAKEINLTESNVKVILHRVRKEMKKKLKNGGYGYGE